MKEETIDIETCLHCKVPMHLHGTACGWSNARGIIDPRNAQEAEWKRLWEESTKGYGSVVISENDAKLMKLLELDTVQEPTTEKLIGRVKDRFKELEGKEFDWKSFYHGWLEGRADWLPNAHLSQSVEEAAKSRYPLYSEQLDLPKHFDADDIAESEQKAFIAGAERQARQQPVRKTLDRYDIDFGGNVMAGIEVEGQINIVGAIDGYGNGIALDNIIITPNAQTKAVEPQHSELIAFASDIVGHDKETIEQMYKDWKTNK